MEITKIIEALAHFNEVWSEITKDAEKQDISSNTYNSICEIDEAVINLVEKVGKCVKDLTISKMYGNSPLSESHSHIANCES